MCPLWITSVHRCAIVPSRRTVETKSSVRSELTKSSTRIRRHGAMAAALAGRTLFITGASRGIGLAIALRAARDGANVAIAAKTTEAHPRVHRAYPAALTRHVSCLGPSSPRQRMWSRRAAVLSRCSATFAARSLCNQQFARQWSASAESTFSSTTHPRLVLRERQRRPLRSMI